MSSRDASVVVIALTTAPDDALAETLARALVTEGLAACVNVLAPMTSHYRWEDRIQRDTERQLVIKTTRDRVEEIQARVAALHSYELPEFLVVPVTGGSSVYLDWVKSSTSGS